MTFTWEHVLYRFYGEDGALLYVGITNSITSRFKWHAAMQPWWSEITSCHVEFLPDRAALQRAEHHAIRFERPKYNVVHSLGVPREPRVRLRRRMSDDEWAWMHGVG